MAGFPVRVQDICEEVELLGIGREGADEFDEVAEELPGLVEFPQQDGDELSRVEQDLVEEGAEILAVEVGDVLPQGFGGLVLGALGQQEFLEGGVVGGQALLDDLVQVVEDQSFVVGVLFGLSGTGVT